MQQMSRIGRAYLAELDHEKQLGRWVPYAVVLAVTWLLVGPRIPLANVAGSSIRLEDAVFAVLWVFVLGRWRSVTRSMPKRQVFFIVVISLIATGFAVFADRVSVGPALLYSLRPLEYWVVFPALYFVFRSGEAKSRKFFVRSFAIVTLIQVGVAALQALLGIDLGFSKFSLERGAGLTAGPYELGAICSMLAVFWIVRRNYVLAAISVCGVLLAASRISIIGLAVGAFFALLISRKSGIKEVVSREKRVLTLLIGSTLLFTSCTLLFLSPMSAQQLGSPVVDRLQDTSTLDAWNTTGGFTSGLQLPENASDYNRLAYGYMPYLLGSGGFASAVSGEASDMVRFFRWHVLIDRLNDPSTITFGLGPSFAGASVDGSFLRMIAETGIVGFAVWLAAIRGWLKNLQPEVSGALIALLVGAVFIDVLYSLRPMVLLWAMIAFSDAERLLASNGAEAKPAPY